MNKRQLNERMKREDELDAVKSYKQRKNHHEIDEDLDEEEMDEALYDFCKKHLK